VPFFESIFLFRTLREGRNSSAAVFDAVLWLGSPSVCEGRAFRLLLDYTSTTDPPSWRELGISPKRISP
jgi:hypothetical protein